MKVKASIKKRTPDCKIVRRNVFKRVALSMVIFAPICQVGCFNADAGVTFSNCSAV